MLISFDFASSVPLYRQLRDQIVLAVAEGRLRPGEKLPPVRILAEESGVNVMTVSKAYQQLKAEGYLRTDRRGGSVLTCPDGQPGATAEQRERLRLCLSELRLAGLHKDDILALCAELCGGDDR